MCKALDYCFVIMLRRWMYLIGVNIAIIISVQIILWIINYFTGSSLTPDTMSGLLVFAAVLGFGSAFVNLAISKSTAKRIYRVQLFDDAGTSDPKLLTVYQTVSEIATSHRIKIPEVGIYNSSEVNAFATGPSKNKSLVAVSSGLLQVMTADEIRGVIGHEMAHILNGDMVTSTLLQ